MKLINDENESGGGSGAAANSIKGKRRQ